MPFSKRHGRTYLTCEACDLVLVAERDLPDRDVEAAQYRLHRNDPDDFRYRRFLSHLTKPLIQRLAAGAEGLDFGSGPGPALGRMLGECGFRVRNYDPLFDPDRSALARQYDFIACTEVVEHFHQPGEMFACLDQMLRPGGVLGVMTSLLRPEIDFDRWAYPRDITHVAFYRPETLQWIARRFSWRLDTDCERLAFFDKLSS